MRNTGAAQRAGSVRRGELAAAAPEGLPLAPLCKGSWPPQRTEGLPPGRGQGGGQAPFPNLLGVRGKGKGPAGPFPSLLGRCREGRSPPDSRGGKGRAKLAPTCTRPAAALKNCTIQDRVSPPRKGVGKPAGCLTLFRSGGVYAARSKFRVEKSHFSERNLPPTFFDVCGEAVRVEKCPSLKASARLRAGTFSDKRPRGPPRSRLTLRFGC